MRRRCSTGTTSDERSVCPSAAAARIRVSSQCLKRHWREATGEWSLEDLGPGRSVRSRRVFSQVIADRLESQGMSIDQILDVLVPIRHEVLGESIKARKVRQGSGSLGRGSRASPGPTSRPRK